MAERQPVPGYLLTLSSKVIKLAQEAALSANAQLVNIGLSGALTSNPLERAAMIRSSLFMLAHLSERGVKPEDFFDIGTAAGAEKPILAFRFNQEPSDYTPDAKRHFAGRVPTSAVVDTLEARGIETTVFRGNTDASSAIAKFIRSADAEQKHKGPIIIEDHLVINQNTRRVTICGTPVDLTNREYELLAYLGVRAGHVASREEIIYAIWGGPRSSSILRTNFNRIRKKLREHWDPEEVDRILRTVEGVGLILGG